MGDVDLHFAIIPKFGFELFSIRLYLLQMLLSLKSLIPFFEAVFIDLLADIQLHIVSLLGFFGLFFRCFIMLFLFLSNLLIPNFISFFNLFFVLLP